MKDHSVVSDEFLKENCLIRNVPKSPQDGSNGGGINTQQATYQCVLCKVKRITHAKLKDHVDSYCHHENISRKNIGVDMFVDKYHGDCVDYSLNYHLEQNSLTVDKLRMRKQMVRKLEERLRQDIQGLPSENQEELSLELYGSLYFNLALNKSDVNCFLRVKEYALTVARVVEVVKNYPEDYSPPQLLPVARGPRILIRHLKHDCDILISPFSQKCLYFSDLMLALVRCDERVGKLAKLLKLHVQDMNLADSEAVSNHMTHIMTVWFCQNTTPPLLPTFECDYGNLMTRHEEEVLRKEQSKLRKVQGYKKATSNDDVSLQMFAANIVLESIRQSCFEYALESGIGVGASQIDELLKEEISDKIFPEVTPANDPWNADVGVEETSQAVVPWEEVRFDSKDNNAEEENVKCDQQQNHTKDDNAEDETVKCDQQQNHSKDDNAEDEAVKYDQQQNHTKDCHAEDETVKCDQHQNHSKDDNAEDKTVKCDQQQNHVNDNNTADETIKCDQQQNHTKGDNAEDETIKCDQQQSHTKDDNAEDETVKCDQQQNHTKDNNAEDETVKCDQHQNHTKDNNAEDETVKCDQQQNHTKDDNTEDETIKRDYIKNDNTEKDNEKPDQEQNHIEGNNQTEDNHTISHQTKDKDRSISQSEETPDCNNQSDDKILSNPSIDNTRTVTSPNDDAVNPSTAENSSDIWNNVSEHVDLERKVSLDKWGSNFYLGTRNLCNNWEIKNKLKLHELWMRMLRELAKFKYDKNLINLRSKKAVPNKDQCRSVNIVEDPFHPSSNLISPVYGVKSKNKKNFRSKASIEIAKHFKEVFEVLKHYYESPHSKRNCLASRKPEENLPPYSLFEFAQRYKVPKPFSELFGDRGTLHQDKLPSLKDVPQNSIDSIEKIILRVVNSKMINDSDFQKREEVFQELRDLIKTKVSPKIECKWFGSSRNGLVLRSSDLDITLDPVERYPPPPEFILNEVAAAIKEDKRFNLDDVILQCRVPIVKFSRSDCDLTGDVAVGNLLAIRNTQLIKAYTEIDERLLQLGYLVKSIVKQCECADASTGSLSSYAYTMMVIFFMQQVSPPVVPVLQEIRRPSEESDLDEYIVEEWDTYFYRDIQKLRSFWQTENTDPVGLLALKFFKFYYEEFDYSTCVIAPKQSEPLKCVDKCWFKSISIEDPFNLDHNLGKQVSPRTFDAIKTVFKQAYKRYIVGPCDKSEETMAHYLDKQYLLDGKAPPINFICYLCKSRDHYKNECPYLGDNCTHCNEIGHTKQNCSKIICHYCNRPGHMVKECPQKNGRTHGKDAASRNGNSSRYPKSNNGHHPPGTPNKTPPGVGAGRGGTPNKVPPGASAGRGGTPNKAPPGASAGRGGTPNKAPPGASAGRGGTPNKAPPGVSAGRGGTPNRAPPGASAGRGSTPKKAPPDASAGRGGTPNKAPPDVGGGGGVATSKIPNKKQQQETMKSPTASSSSLTQQNNLPKYQKQRKPNITNNKQQRSIAKAAFDEILEQPRKNRNSYSDSHFNGENSAPKNKGKKKRSSSETKVDESLVRDNKLPVWKEEAMTSHSSTNRHKMVESQASNNRNGCKVLTVSTQGDGKISVTKTTPSNNNGPKQAPQQPKKGGHYKMMGSAVTIPVPENAKENARMKKSKSQVRQDMYGDYKPTKLTHGTGKNKKVKSLNNKITVSQPLGTYEKKAKAEVYHEPAVKAEGTRYPPKRDDDYAPDLAPDFFDDKVEVHNPNPFDLNEWGDLTPSMEGDEVMGAHLAKENSWIDYLSSSPEKPISKPSPRGYTAVPYQYSGATPYDSAARSPASQTLLQQIHNPPAYQSSQQENRRNNHPNMQQRTRTTSNGGSNQQHYNFHPPQEYDPYLSRPTPPNGGQPPNWDVLTRSPGRGKSNRGRRRH